MISLAAILLVSFIEIMTVLAIVAILAAFLIPPIIHAKEKAEATAKSMELAEDINKALDDCEACLTQKINGDIENEDAPLHNELKYLKEKIDDFLKNSLPNNDGLSNLATDKINAVITELSKYINIANKEDKFKANALLIDLKSLKAKMPREGTVYPRS